MFCNNFKILLLKFFIISFLIIENQAKLYDHDDIFQNCELTYDENLNRVYKLCTNITLSDTDQIFGDPSENNDVRFINCSMVTFPKLFSKLFRATRHLTIRNCGLRQISDDFSENLSHYLYTVDLSENLLTVLTINSFKTEEKLEILNLSKNKIKFLESGVFSKTSELKELYLQQNQLISLNNDLLKECELLEKIDLSDNQLTTLSDIFFENNRRLKEVSLKNNKFITLNNKLIFSQQNHLTILDVSYNPLKIFEFTSAIIVKATNTDLNMCHISSTEEVYVNNSKIDTLILNKEIEKLFLSNNSLTKFSIIHDNINDKPEEGSKITHLDLSLNNLNDHINFKYMDNLRYLNLSNTKINKSLLNERLFLYTSKLQLLDLSSNNLTTLNDKLLYPLLNLNYFYINDNNLKEFRYELDVSIEASLVEIDISGNQWNCTYLKKMLIYFSKNNIQLRSIGLINAAHIDTILLPKIGCIQDNEYKNNSNNNDNNEQQNNDLSSKNATNVIDKNDLSNVVAQLTITVIVLSTILLIIFAVIMYFVWKNYNRRRPLEIRNPLMELNGNCDN